MHEGGHARDGTLVTILSAAYLVSMMFALGLELGGGPKETKEQKRAKRRMLVRGLFLNLVVLPLVAFGITRALHARSEVAVALLLLAVVPGGRYARARSPSARTVGSSRWL